MKTVPLIVHSFNKHYRSIPEYTGSWENRFQETQGTAMGSYCSLPVFTKILADVKGCLKKYIFYDYNTIFIMYKSGGQTLYLVFYTFNLLFLILLCSLKLLSSRLFKLAPSVLDKLQKRI